MQHYTDARTALIRRGLRLPTRKALEALSRASLALVRADDSVDPRRLEAITINNAKAILHRDVVASILEL